MVRCLALAALLLCGCATTQNKPASNSRAFIWKQDTFAYANELVWIYNFDPGTGKTSHSRREPAPTYSHHCFVVARSALQFFYHARFDPSLPVAAPEIYRKLIDKVVSRRPVKEWADSEKVVIPGYSNLFTFSQAQGSILKQECGGAWQSYFQRGHWRMIWPFTRYHQQKTAEALVASLKLNHPPVIHVVRFPQLSINHALVVMSMSEKAQSINFQIYDPNSPEKPTELLYDRQARTFQLPKNNYFQGGRVDVYRIYDKWNY
jgi:hypothetical protein